MRIRVEYEQHEAEEADRLQRVFTDNGFMSCMVVSMKDPAAPSGNSKNIKVELDGRTINTQDGTVASGRFTANLLGDRLRVEQLIKDLFDVAEKHLGPAVDEEGTAGARAAFVGSKPS